MTRTITLQPPVGSYSRASFTADAKELDVDPEAVIDGDFVVFKDADGCRYVIDGMTLTALR